MEEIHKVNVFGHTTSAYCKTCSTT